MFLLLNGPFGIGKSSTALLVAEQLPAHVLDPEVLGLALWGLGVRTPDMDYRELAVWRDLVVAAAETLHRHVSADLVVPMNLLHREAYDDLFDRLGQIDTVRAACLTASPDVLRARILGRADADGPHDWCLRHMDADLATATDPSFGTTIQTDDCSIEQVADRIVAIARA